MDDVHEHRLVPEHRLLDEDETERILDEYNVERTNLPKIKDDDPALPDGAGAGDVIEITRDSRTTDQAVVYRLVVE